MTDGEALLRAILANPADDTVRLVYADWLGENGEPERAEFIRVQCEVWSLLTTDFVPGVPLVSAGYSEGKGVDEVAYFVRSSDEARYKELRARERVLWATSLGWAHPFNGALDWFRRGFVESVSCSAAEWLEHAHAVTAAHPLAEVNLTDREPYPRNVERCFWAHPSVPGAGDHANVPVRIFLALGGFDNRGASKQRVRWYNSRADAFAALSRACVAHGRKLAGLPPLNPA